jgi:histidine triad (HIT) family protein
VHNHEPADYRCPFCLNLTGAADLPLEIIHRDEHVFVKVNPRWWPNNPGSVLVVPVEHHENVFDLPPELGTPIQRAVRDAAIAMKRAFGCDGVSTRQHNEPAGNQDVWHYHVHVFPRWDGDGLYRSERSPADPDELRRRADQLRAAWPTAD